MLAMNWGDGVEVIRDYFKKNRFSFQPVRQKAEEVSQAYGVKIYPTNYVIGPDGRVDAAMVGFKEAVLRKALDKLASERK